MMSYGVFVEKRSIVKAIIFTIITCGFYGFYWMYKLTEENHILAQEKTTASGGMAILFSLITCGIYSIYWIYKMGETMNIAKEKRGMRTEPNISIIYLVLSIFGLFIVAEALLQDGINDVIEYDLRNGGGAEAEEVPMSLPEGQNEEEKF